MAHRRHAYWPAPLLLLCTASAPVLAVDISGDITAGAIYSDNVTLAPDGLEDGDLIYRVAPTINLSSAGNRYDFRLDYTLEALYYQDQADSTEVYNQGEGSLVLELLEERLLLNSLASISQVVIDPEQPFSSSNIPQIGNRTDAKRFRVGPEWREEFLGTTLDARYDIARINYSDETVQDSKLQDLNTDWKGPEKDRGLTWGVHHEYQSYDYDISEDAKRQLVEASLIYELAGGWAPFLSAGLESDVQDRSDASLEDGIWRAGLRRNTARTRMEAYIGERSFGSSWGASFQRQYGAGMGDVIRLSYAETPTTNEEFDQVISLPDESPDAPPTGPVIPPVQSPPDISAPGTGRFYLEKRGDLILSRSFNRNAVSANVFYEQDETFDDTSPADGDTTRQTGLTLAWSYELGASTQAVLDGYYADREFSRTSSADDQDNIFRVRLTLDHQLGLRTLLSGWLAREERTGSEDVLNNYEENQIGLYVGRTFGTRP